jgi:hypothetical protein
MHAGADAKILETVWQMCSRALPWMPAVRWPYSISCVSEGLVTSHDECSPLLQYLHQDTVRHATVDHNNVVDVAAHPAGTRASIGMPMCSES